ncbi:putative beta-barrel porin [Dysgonomonas alginatilytica]|uniref:Putative beta-barrel porin n=1 Tax=Dysgonomonas alginatilytica TaxID=1605892 RepID=A0A2V3PJF8_9BACT|nr:putative porin [Dysgonomonas alginatilytica]PXV58423.1 putative beta-barrel porin [Dysgonomonas alginatilytica]
MKRIAFIILYICASVLVIQAQEPRFIFDNDSTKTEAPAPQRASNSKTPSVNLDSLNKVPPAVPAWNIDPRLGERIPIPMDTMLYGFHRESLVEGQGLAIGYLGNWGSPAYSKLFIEQDDASLFQFLDPYKFYYKTPGNQRFLSTKQPYSNIMYQSGGSRQSKEERFTGEISISFDKHLTVGFDIDYVYSRGFYQYNPDKQINYDFYAAYVSDKYQMHAFVANNNFTHSENGGILYDGYLNGTDPDNVGKDNTLSFQTHLSETWNYLRGKHLYMTNKYNLGYEKEGTEKFIPVASVILTNSYTDQRRRFYSRNVEALDEFYNYTPPSINTASAPVNDQMAYYSFKNTLAVSLNEGFRDWVKFGLTAFIEQDMRIFRMPGENFRWITTNDHSQKATFIGGVLSKEKGEFLRYNLYADLGVFGYNAGEYKLKADISTTINIKGQKAIVKANGYIKSLVPQFFQQDFSSKYHNWKNNDFSDTRRVFVGGEIYIPHTETRLSGGVENIKNYIYYKKTDLSVANAQYIHQEGENIQVISLRLDQNLHYGILHWDNQVSFQTSTNTDVIPVPKLSLYTNLYIKAKLAKVLTMQLGVDAHYHTKYYALGYDPALGQFVNQTDKEVGNFPFSTVYANFHLKKTRFFVMMYNVAKDFGDSNYFTVPTYPVNPMIFKFGLSWNFNN